MKHLYFFLVFTLLFQPLSVYGKTDSSSLTVTTAQVLHVQANPYTFQNIIIASGGSLLVEPGVSILLSKGGSIDVIGTFLLAGTPEQHIHIGGADLHHPWQSLHIHTGSISMVSYTDFSSSAGALVIQSMQTTWDHVSFTDGVENVLQFENPTGTPASPTLGNLTFINRQLGNSMGNNGVLFFGNFDRITLNSFAIEDERIHSEHYLIGIRVNGSYRVVTVNSGTFNGTCRGAFETRLSGQVSFMANPDTCLIGRIPVVFVPGYGTSINLEKLASSTDRTITPTGWRFLRSLTPSYFQLLDDLTAHHISYEVAYYDWRLPITDIVNGYLRPAIERAKQKAHAPYVYVVAHSYGGLVTRWYVQGASYQNDVHTLVELGTPNLGAAKAYPVWEAGELPPDWQAIQALIRLYQYEHPFTNLSSLQVIHQYFPSVQDLLPIYPAVYYRGILQDPQKFTYKNTTGLTLANQQQLLAERVRLIQVFSSSEATPETVTTINKAGSQRQLWPDGAPEAQQLVLANNGDGTVPVQSAKLPGYQAIEVTGDHNSLPSAGRSAFIPLLYPNASYSNNQPVVALEATHWFVFDCPVEVTITLPDGSVRTSAQPDAPNQVGEVESSGPMLWIILPSQVGEYKVHIRALQETNVRFWVDDGVITTKSLLQNQIWETNYQKKEVLSLPNSPTTPPVEVAQITTGQFTFHFGTFQFPRVTAFREQPVLLLELPRRRVLFTPQVKQPRSSKKAPWALVIGLIVLSALLILLRRRRE